MPLMTLLKFWADQHRHLICTPYSVENLHEMAKELDIKRCWYHAGPGIGAAIERLALSHYDIPKRRVAEILGHPKVTVIKQRQLYTMIRDAQALSKRITEALDKALNDGYELWLFTPYDVARDLHQYDAGLTLVPPFLRIFEVTRWYRQKFQGKRR